MPKAKKPTRTNLLVRRSGNESTKLAKRLLEDLRGLSEQGREHVALAVNSALMGLSWSIGKRIREDMHKEQRAGYGEEILQTLPAKLLS